MFVPQVARVSRLRGGAESALVKLGGGGSDPQAKVHQEGEVHEGSYPVYLAASHYSVLLRTPCYFVAPLAHWKLVYLIRPFEL